MGRSVEGEESGGGCGGGRGREGGGVSRIPTTALFCLRKATGNQPEP